MLMGNLKLTQVISRSCSTFFIEHDFKFSASVVLDDNCLTQPRTIEIEKLAYKN